MDVSKVSSAAVTSAEAVKQSNAQAATQAGSQKAAQAHGDTANLSSAGLATGGSDVRTEKIASVQQALAAGNYHVGSSHVADKIITSLLGQ